jgi:predicted acyltransferase (DUF342 family)
MAIYIIGFISYGATLVFYAAVFPRLARNTPHARALRVKYEAGEIDPLIYEKEESLEKNRISNISTVGDIIFLNGGVSKKRNQKGTQQYWIHSRSLSQPFTSPSTCG